MQGAEVELNVESPGFLELGLPKGAIGKVVNASTGEVQFLCQNGKSAKILMSDSELKRKTELNNPDGETEQYLKALGVAICCDIADELDSGWYDFVNESNMADAQFIRELAQRLDSTAGFDLRGRFPLQSTLMKPMG